MKKIIALVLALVMTLSLLPTTVWATEGTAFKHNNVEIYTLKNAGVGTYNDWDTYDGLTKNDGETSVMVPYYPGNLMRLFFKPASGVTLEVPTDSGAAFQQYASISYEESTGIWELQLTSEATGNGAVWLNVSGGSGIDLQFVPQSSGGDGGDQGGGGSDSGGDPFSVNGVEVYTNKSQGVGTYNDWSTYDGLEYATTGGGAAAKVYYNPGQTCKLFLKTTDSSVTLTGIGGSLGEKATLGSMEASTYIYELVLNDTAEGQGNVWVSLSNGNGVDILFVPAGNQGDNQEIMRSEVVVPSTATLPISDIPADVDHWDYIGVQKIDTIDEVDYYFGLVRHESGNLLDVKWDGNGLSQGAQTDIQLAIGFWKQMGQQRVLLEGAELTAFLAKFSDLKIELKLYTDDANNTAEIEYPWTRSLANDNSAISPYPCCTEYVFNQYSQGKWLLIASGMYEGNEVVARGYTNKEMQLVEEIDATRMTTVEEINEAIEARIETLGETYSGKLAVELPAGTLEGIIVVPDFDNEVMLNGKSEGEEVKTVLKGGIIVNSESFHVGSVRFVGKGRDVTTNNSAISGTACGGYDHCTFTGYDRAVCLTEGLAGGNYNFFYDNNIGIYIDDPDGLVVGNHQIYKTVFAHNGTDIEISNADGLPGETKFFAIWNTIFIGSERNVYVADTLREVLFMPKNAFDDGTAAVDEPEVEGMVSATPYFGLSEKGIEDLYDLEENAAKVAHYLANPRYDDEWIDDTDRRFNSEWMCPERPDDRDFYNIPGDVIINQHNRMDIKVMGERDGCHEHVATITLTKAD